MFTVNIDATKTMQVESVDPEQYDEYENVILEEFNDSKYEQKENITMDDNYDNTDFRLCESFDIGINSVRGKQEGKRFLKKKCNKL